MTTTRTIGTDITTMKSTTVLTLQKAETDDTIVDDRGHHTQIDNSFAIAAENTDTRTLTVLRYLRRPMETHFRWALFQTPKHATGSPDTTCKISNLFM